MCWICLEKSGILDITIASQLGMKSHIRKKIDESPWLGIYYLQEESNIFEALKYINVRRLQNFFYKKKMISNIIICRVIEYILEIGYSEQLNNVLALKIVQWAFNSGKLSTDLVYMKESGVQSSAKIFLLNLKNMSLFLDNDFWLFNRYFGSDTLRIDCQNILQNYINWWLDGNRLELKEDELGYKYPSTKEYEKFDWLYRYIFFSLMFLFKKNTNFVDYKINEIIKWPQYSRGEMDSWLQRKALSLLFQAKGVNYIIKNATDIEYHLLAYVCNRNNFSKKDREYVIRKRIKCESSRSDEDNFWIELALKPNKFYTL